MVITPEELSYLQWRVIPYHCWDDLETFRGNALSHRINVDELHDTGGYLIHHPCTLAGLVYGGLRMEACEGAAST